MSILKGIMHHWNKTKNDYDVIHPETDYKKITDWNEGIVATLASTALGTLVSTLTSDSLLATMIQKVLTATGVKYNIAQNGYVCFGSLFGGLIIQWGSNRYGWVAFPLAFAKFRKIVTNHQGVSWMQSQARESGTLIWRTGQGISNLYAYWISLGK